MSNNHITLTTPDKLDDELLNKWINIVSQLSTTNTVKDKKVKITHNNDKYRYIINLTNHLPTHDISFITTAWEHYYTKNFEITSSDQYTLKDEELNVLLEKISKYLHNRWIDDSISNGWRYGTKYSLKQKTHPALRDWDSLPIEYRKTLPMTPKQAVDFSNKYL